MMSTAATAPAAALNVLKIFAAVQHDPVTIYATPDAGTYTGPYRGRAFTPTRHKRP
ncbi:hypothetical protein Esi_0718_0002 [Ectocarpus siliculosus]|uniref:Uncharacterized protein n=1 Tax=Ectocarpus siliculosus TaxID=2880 RepID=D7G668_ECTSI|nr:hypothetical protein Esi_0718_0002 [Ectocarpus siliculosus]|eukprot:CBJ33931.1 hypothetical protein Esi_0718_0002 [Ectocarpus siliculosus]